MGEERTSATTTPKRLLIAEDDARFISQIEKMELGELVIARDLKASIRLLDEAKELDGAILDLFMLFEDAPYHRAYLQDRAGFIVATEFIHRYPDQPVIVTTGAPWTDVPSDFQRLQQSGVFLFLHKFDKEFERKAREFLLFSEPPSDPGLLRRLWDSLILQPNFMGLGIDLKVLLDSLTRPDLRQ